VQVNFDLEIKRIKEKEISVKVFSSIYDLIIQKGVEDLLDDNTFENLI